MANAITVFRIAAGIVLLFCPVFSPAFYVFYIAAGLSDMLDGFVARQTDSVSKLGARLDTTGDRKAMEAGGGKYLNFIKIVMRKKN